MERNQMGKSLSTQDRETTTVALRARLIEGYGYGLQVQPIISELEIKNINKDNSYEYINQAFNEIFEKIINSQGVTEEQYLSKIPKTEGASNAIEEWFIKSYYLSQSFLRIPTEKKGVVVNTQNPRKYIILGYWSKQCSKECLRWSVSSLNRLLSSPNSPQKAQEQIKERLVELRERIKKFALNDVNSIHMINAALKNQIDVEYVPGHINNMITMGKGQNSNVIVSSLSQKCSAIGSHIANNKVTTLMFLRAAGFPVPQKTTTATTIEKALSKSKDIGYPVCIKPEGQDGGIGVFAKINNEEELKKYFPICKSYTKRVVIQSRCEGKDYRINVCNGTIIKALERVPGGVIGDGKHTISELITKEQKTQRQIAEYRAKGKYSLVLDEEAIDLITSCGKSGNTVPKEHEYIALRAKANISSGGTQTILNPKDIHPLNQELIKDCAHQSRLHTAGIDIIAKDIMKESWIESNFSIIEVNSVPQIGSEGGTEAYEEFIKLTITNNGRINTHLAIGKKDTLSTAQLQDLCDYARNNNLKNISHKGFLMRGGTPSSKAFMNNFDAAKTLLRIRTVESALIYMSISEILKHGIPTKNIDAYRLIDSESTTDNSMTNELSQLLDPHLANS